MKNTFGFVWHALLAVVLCVSFTSCSKDGDEINPGEGGSPNLIAGTFSVSSTKKVQFTKGNLYWDGSAYHFETNQTDYPELWNASHVGHFYWTSLNDYQSGYTDLVPFAQRYASTNFSHILSYKFFCGEDSPLTVDGISGCFALSRSEWHYLIYARTNATKLCKYGVTVGGKVNCLIIAPDGFSGGLKSSYTLYEVNSLGLVCLPAAGTRDSWGISGAENWGGYWSSTPFVEGGAYALYFDSDYVYEGDNFDRSIGLPVRLVRLAQ